MPTELFPIPGEWPGRLSVSPRPRGDDWLSDEIRAWRAAGIDVVVSLLTSEEAADLGLERERQTCEENGIRFEAFPIVDRSVPASDPAAVRLIDEVNAELRRGRNVNIHCRQGIGRSSLIAASLFIDQGLPPSKALQRITEARRVPVPETLEQRAWIDHFAASLQRRS
jgi:protein-tyrosine phosphatase